MDSQDLNSEYWGATQPILRLENMFKERVVQGIPFNFPTMVLGSTGFKLADD